MKALVLGVAALALVACGASPELKEQPLAKTTQGLSLSAAGTVPYPIIPIVAFGQDHPDVNWDGTLVDLLAADALAMCSPGGQASTVFHADRYLVYLQEKMSSTPCPLGPSNETPMSLENRWIKQRTQFRDCNYRGDIKQNAVLALPSFSAGSARWDGADAIIYDESGFVPYRWQGYVLSPPPPAPATQDPIMWAGAAQRAGQEMMFAATNLCMANRLREQMLTMDVLTASGAEQRQMLAVIRERAQVAMLELALFGRAFANSSASSLTITDPAAFLPVLRRHYERLIPPVFQPDLRIQLANDLAGAVKLEIDVTHELVELLARSSAARADLSDLGGSGFTDLTADVEWGTGGWRSRALDALYGGDPLGSLISGSVVTPLSSNWMWGGFAGLNTPWDGERVLHASLSKPEVQTLFGLARQADILWLKRKTTGEALYDVDATGDFLWRAEEATLRNEDCKATPGATCNLKADSPGVPLSTNYQDGVLWQRYRISREHAVALAEALSEGLPAPSGLFADRGPFHVSGNITTKALPDQLASGSGTWDHLAADFSFSSLPNATRASARAALAGFYLPDSFVNAHYASAQGFVGMTSNFWGAFYAPWGVDNDSLRYLGTVDALAAVRDAYVVGQAASPGAPEFYSTTTTPIKQVLGLIDSAIGTSTLAVRPVLEQVAVRMPVPPAGQPPAPCGEWTNQNGTSQTGSTCQVLAMQIVSADTTQATLKATVHLLRPSGSSPIDLLLVQGTDIQTLTGDAWNIRHIANVASESTFVSPATSLSSGVPLATQQIDRNDLDTLANTNKVAPASSVNNSALGILRDTYNITWKVGLTSGVPVGANPVLLAVTRTTPKKYVVLSENFALPTFNWGESRVSGTNPVFRSEAGYYFGGGGSFGSLASRIQERHPTEWSRPAYDGFGYPIDWTPPTTPELLAGASDPIAFYLSGAKEAAQDATTAVTKALDEVVQDSADTQKLQASRERAAVLPKLEQQAVCGTGSTGDCIAAAATADYTPSLQINCTEPNDYCPIVNFAVAATLPTGVKVLKAVQERLLLNTPPSFPEFEGGSLQTLALDQWKAIKDIERAVVEAGPRIEKLWHQNQAATDAYYTAWGQYFAQLVLDDAIFKRLQDESNYRCATNVDCTAQPPAGQLPPAGCLLKAKAWYGMFTWKSGSETWRADENNWLQNPTLGKGDDATTGWNPQTYWTWQDNCIRSQRALDEHMVVTAPHQVVTFLAAEQTMMAARFEADEAAQSIVSALITKLAELQRTNLAIKRELAGLGRTQAKLLFDAFVEQSGNASQLAITRRYHQPDMWRARALLENARRLAVAARRSVEARYNVDLSTMNEDEPFVAAPSVWADQVYSYDLDPPSAVGLSRSGGAVSGVYPNQLVDYVRNLENFVRGYPVLRPTAATASDTEVISLPGPGATEDVDGVGGVGKDRVSPDASRWSFQCADDGPWLANPLLAPAGGTRLNYTFEELAAPFKNHGFGSGLDLSVATGTVAPVQPAIGLFAANFNSGYLTSANTSVGETAGGLTMSTWVNLRTYPGAGATQILVAKNYHTTGWTSPLASAALLVDSTGGVNIYWTFAGNPTQIVTSNKIPLKKWTHVAVTFDGINVRLYLNGQSVLATTTGTTSRALDWGQHGAWLIGGAPTTTPISGWIGQTRVDSTVHNYLDILDEYSRGVSDSRASTEWEFTQPTPPYPSTGTIPSIPLNSSIGSVASFPSPPFASTADFNGASCVSSGATSAGETPSQITLSVWVYPRSVNTATSEILVKSYGASTWANPFVSVGLNILNGAPRAMMATSTTAPPTQVTSSAVLPLNQWSHLAMTFDGSVLTLYVNGVVKGTATVTGAPVLIDWGGHGPWMVGGNSIVNAEFFNGRIADARIEAVVRPQEFFLFAYGRGLTGQCFYDTYCEAQGDCCPDRQVSPLDNMCTTGRPIRARIQFHTDPWGREGGNVVGTPYKARHNVRWGRLAVNLVGTGVRDCMRADDAPTCYAESFLRYDLSHGGPAWSTDFTEQWHIRPMPIGRIEAGKALAAEEWLDPIANSWNQPFVSNIARSELIKRPVSGTYTLDVDLGGDVRADRIRRVQLLMETEYWVSQR